MIHKVGQLKKSISSSLTELIHYAVELNPENKQ